MLSNYSLIQTVWYECEDTLNISVFSMLTALHISIKRMHASISGKCEQLKKYDMNYVCLRLSGLLSSENTLKLKPSSKAIVIT